MSTAAIIVGLHLATAHAGGVGLESVTPGVYARMPNGITAGAYRNSHGLGSAYLGMTWSTADGRWSITAGGVTGYPRAKVSPLLVPSMRLPINGTSWAARLAYLPKPHSDGAQGVHLSLERAL